MASRAVLSAVLIAGGLAGVAGQSVAGAEAPAAPVLSAAPGAPVNVPVSRSPAVVLTRPSDNALYRFVGHPVIQPWASVRRHI